MTAVLDRESPLLRDLSARARHPAEFARLRSQLRATGYCARPVRLRGQIEVVDAATGELRKVFDTRSQPDRVLRKACGDRREAVCPACADRYRGDAFQLVACGLRGGKGIPDTVAGHPALFVTLTAPAFGLVHTRPHDNGGAPRRCRPRRDAPVCPHGARLSCTEKHADDDPCLGEPLCRECFDYEAATVWNNAVGRLWRVTTTYLPRKLAAARGITHKQLRSAVRVSYIKVAEYQRRGLIHLHVVIRLDRAMPTYRADELHPPAGRAYTRELLADAVRLAVADASCPAPEGLEEHGRVRWGDQLHIEHVHGDHDAHRCAGYIAKYATKATDVCGGTVYRLKRPSEIDTLALREHPRAFLEQAFRLDRRAPDARFARWAHANGYRGHCLTKSRRYSTTFKALRAAREQHVLDELRKRPAHDPQRQLAEAPARRSSFTFAGIGHVTTADAHLAAIGARRTREHRQHAAEARHVEQMRDDWTDAGRQR